MRDLANILFHCQMETQFGSIKCINNCELLCQEESSTPGFWYGGKLFNGCEMIEAMGDLISKLFLWCTDYTTLCKL